MDAKNISV